MKLSAARLRSLLADQNLPHAGFLLFGNEPARISQLRDKLVDRIGGPDAISEMRVERVDAKEIPADSSRVADLVQAVSFFGGRRVVCVENAAGSIWPSIERCFANWTEDHATLVVSAGTLPASSKLRKLFETNPRLASVAVYPGKPQQSEVVDALAEAGLSDVSQEALQDLVVIAGEHETAELQNLVEKLALYKLNDDTQLQPKEVAECAPLTGETALDEVLNAVAGRRAADIGPAIRKLSRNDRRPARMCTQARTLFRNILLAASHPQGPRAGAMSIRPPLYFERRDNMIRFARLWGAEGARQALQDLSQVDLQVRTNIRVPAEATVERVFMRLALRKLPSRD
ncbi:MAG: hypothetical protein OXB95_12510 [Rhodobacteraceae bacterium]|nr:hypothetical protein [Paracoccaceae bacterium]